ncbi:MAG: DNA-binding response regulator [Rhodospirillaceae bacterium]|jgi:two-component system nitrate/nitrite response regulator NarL|nr:DNA-binding response regulator [Rhodospirillaceae bacterium]|tara:strand:- start:1594 stop:2271 length:678 start_codon:yes stop_codon:yes gene_type:complete
MTQEQEKVAILAKDRLFRESLVGLLAQHNLTVAWQGSDIAGIANCQRSGETIDLVVLDFPEGASDNLRRLRFVHSTCPEARIVVLENALNHETMAESFRQGADGYLLKDISGEVLAQSIKLVLLGEKVFPSALALLLETPYSISRLSTGGGGEGGPLSARERQILGCLVRGEPNKVIAAQLGITEATVKVHLKTILRKINARNRTQAAIWAINSGLGGDVDRQSA